MAKVKKESKKFIVSCRINDDEMYLLRLRANSEGVSITQLLRNCLNFAENEVRKQSPENREYACG